MAWLYSMGTGAVTDGLEHFASLHTPHGFLVCAWGAVGEVVGFEVTQSMVVEAFGVFDACFGEQFATCVVREIRECWWGLFVHGLSPRGVGWGCWRLYYPFYSTTFSD